MTHTPGPWRAVPPGADGSNFLNWIVGSDEPSAPGGSSKTLVSVVKPHATAYGEADARLIAAAPMMLAALEMVCRIDDDCRLEGLPTLATGERASIDYIIRRAKGDGA